MSTEIEFKGMKINFTMDELNLISENAFEKKFEDCKNWERNEVKHICLVKHILEQDLDNLMF